MHLGLKEGVLTLWLVAAAAGVAVGLRFLGAPATVPTLCLAAAVAGASAWGLMASLLAAASAVLVLNWAFTEPLYTLWVNDPWSLVVFGLVATIALAVGIQAHRADQQGRLRRRREQRLDTLYQLSLDLNRAETEAAVDEVVAHHRQLEPGATASMDALQDLARGRVRRAREAQVGEVLQGLSHDWRTPLAVIAAQARAAGLDAVDHEAQQLSRQLDTVLALARGEAGALVPVVLPAEELVYSVRDQRRFAADRLSVVVPSTVVWVRVDPGLVEQALGNLVENADRYGAGSPIDLELTADPTAVEFCVKDRGPGIAEADRDRVFERFFRGTTAAGTRGSGLGLALVAQVARWHGGSAGVRSRPGGGAEVWIRLPRQEAP